MSAFSFAFPRIPTRMYTHMDSLISLDWNELSELKSNCYEYFNWNLFVNKMNDFILIQMNNFAFRFFFSHQSHTHIINFFEVEQIFFSGSKSNLKAWRQSVFIKDSFTWVHESFGWILKCYSQILILSPFPPLVLVDAWTKSHLNRIFFKSLTKTEQVLMPSIIRIKDFPCKWCFFFLSFKCNDKIWVCHVKVVKKGLHGECEFFMYTNSVDSSLYHLRY